MITITPKLAGLVAASAVALMAPAALAANPHKKVKAAPKTQKAPAKSVKAAAWSFPPCTNTQAEYEYIYSGDPCTSDGSGRNRPDDRPGTRDRERRRLSQPCEPDEPGVLQRPGRVRLRLLGMRRVSQQPPSLLEPSTTDQRGKEESRCSISTRTLAVNSRPTGSRG